MLIIGMKPGHDGATAAVEDGRLLFNLEAEKDSYRRHAELGPATILETFERLDRWPDVVAVGGWTKNDVDRSGLVGGYEGLAAGTWRSTELMGRRVEMFSSSHERSHLFLASGLSDLSAGEDHVVLVWEGHLGNFYLIRDNWRVIKRIPALSEPGTKYDFLYDVADPSFPDIGAHPKLDGAGKLMALAAYGRDETPDPRVVEFVEQVFRLGTLHPAPKHLFRDSPLYNAGPESDLVKSAAALLGSRIFEIFREVAATKLPRGLPLTISGGCGLNCDWNTGWVESALFRSVFVPPCPNDSGSALGTALDAQHSRTGNASITWSVYAGTEFLQDAPVPPAWRERELDVDWVADVLARGNVIAWVQGRYELGPRALGNRSLLAEPFSESTRDRLNEIKKRESYRPIAPACREEELGEHFAARLIDPHMLYFNRVKTAGLKAVTHVDGTARVQTVSRAQNPAFHDLLTAFGRRTGAGVLCNTSLNHRGAGFINRTSDLVPFCDTRGVDHMVIGHRLYSR